MTRETDVALDAAGEPGDDSSQISTLPTRWYSDSEVYALEEKRIFEQSWHYFCHGEQVGRPGDYLSRRIGKVPITMVRTANGELKGFVNVCRHRLHVLLGAEGNCKVIRCPYHSWTYDLNGNLLRVPDVSARAKSHNIGLVPVAVGQWGPLVFVNPQVDTPNGLGQVLGDLPVHAEANGITFADKLFKARRRFELNCNWKVYVENALECYHCQVNHPALSRLIDVRSDAYLLDISKWYSCQRSHRLDPSRPSHSGVGGEPGDEGAGEPGDRFYFYYLWPTTFLGTVTGAESFAVHYIEPLQDSATRLTIDYFFSPEVSDERVRAAVEANTMTLEEDRSLVESVQVGLQSGSIPFARLVLPRENLVSHFQALVTTAMS